MNKTESPTGVPVQRMVSRRTIELGALCPKLSKQLAGLKVPKDRLRILDKHAHALTWCYVHSLITDAEHSRAGKRLIAKVNVEVRKAANIVHEPHAPKKD